MACYTTISTDIQMLHKFPLSNTSHISRPQYGSRVPTLLKYGLENEHRGIGDGGNSALASKYNLKSDFAY